MAQVKSMRIIFKSGAAVVTPYSNKVMREVGENIGKDHMVDAANFTANTKEIAGIFYEVTEVAE